MRQIMKLMALFAVVLLCTGAAWAAEQTGTITIYLEDGMGNLCLYQAEDYGDGEDADNLASFVRDNDIPGITMPINGSIPTVFEDLPPGVYLVTHEQDVFRPFFVSIPITINGMSTFHVEARPKTLGSQSPQTGDHAGLHLLAAVFLASLIGLVVLVSMVCHTQKSFPQGKMCTICVQNKQKRL